MATPLPATASVKAAAPAAEAFRFFDNREKYLMFVTTCSEKWAVAERIGLELDHLRPKPPALRLFDAGLGDGSVLTRVMRHAHKNFPHIPFLVVGKEISLEDVRLSLEKLPDRLHEHPHTVVVATNMLYSAAPQLMPRDPAQRSEINWIEVKITGSTAYEFEKQITDLQPVLADAWQTKIGPKTGNPIYVRPSVLVIYREDHAFSLDSVIPRLGEPISGYDLVIASQPYRARVTAAAKIKNVLAPMARCLAPGGRMIAVQSTGNDPGMEIIRKVWPDDNPFKTPRHELIQELKTQLEPDAANYKFTQHSDRESLFTYRLHSLPLEVRSSIGTSTLLAAWNAAVYVAQIDDDRLTEVLNSSHYLDVTHEVVQKHGGLWFLNESFVVERK